MAASLNLKGIDSVLTSHQSAFFDEALPAALSTAAFARFKRRRYAPHTIAWGRAAWELRTLDEYRSQVGFSEFLLEVTELGCAYDVVTAAVRVVRDEARHVELCRRLVNALGGSDRIPGEPQWVRSDVNEPVRTRVLITILGSLCIGETLSMALLAATRKVTTDPLAHEVLTVLTRDEAFHSQLGWRLLEQLWPTLDARLKKKLVRRLQGDLAHARSAVFAGAEYDDSSEPRNPFGHLKNDERKKTFERALANIFRRFDRLDIPARAAWVDA